MSSDWIYRFFNGGVVCIYGKTFSKTMFKETSDHDFLISGYKAAGSINKGRITIKMFDN